MNTEGQHGPTVSRRGLVRGAAGAAVLGGAVLAAGRTPAQAHTASETGRAGAAGAAAIPKPADRRAADETVVVHVRDARTGDLDIYVGDRHLRLRDRDLTSRLVAAAR